MGTFFSWQPAAIALPQAVAAVLAAVAAAFVRSRARTDTGAAWLWLVLIGAALWSAAGSLEFTAVDLRAKILWSQISYIGIVLGPVALFHFTYAYINDGGSPPRSVSAVLLGCAAVILAAAFTNAWHGLLWPQVVPVQRGDLVFARYERGPMFWVTVAYCYGFMLTSSALLVRHTFALGGIFLQQAWIILLATFAPWIASIIYVLRLGPRPELDHTPVGFAATGLLLTWAMLRMRLFELTPVAANSLFARIPDPVLVVDAAGRLVRINAAARTCFGQLDRHTGAPLATALAGHPQLAAALAEPGDADSNRLRELDGVWWNQATTFLGSPGGRPRGRLIVLRDVTEQKRTELELAAALARADALAREAVAANAAKSRFLAQVSHDLRTPLHSILGMTEMLLGSRSENSGREQVAVIREAGEGLLRLINDLLDLSVIEAGRINLRHEPFQLDGVLDALADLLNVSASRKGLAFAHWIEPGLGGGLRGDPDRLRQVLLNLAGNAVKFTRKGTVTVRALPGASAGWLRLEIADTGPGIPPERLAGLFTPFNRGDPGTSRGIEGTGLGLVIARHLVEAMRGTIAVKSTPGAGTAFTVELPIVDESATDPAFLALRAGLQDRRVAVQLSDPLQAQAVTQGLLSLGARPEPVPPGRVPAGFFGTVDAARASGVVKRGHLAAGLLGLSVSAVPPPAAPPAHGWHVLLADDTPLSRRVSAALLERCGCTVVAVDGGLAALEKLRTERFDCVVLDGMMPDLDGWQVARRLRQPDSGVRDKDVPVIALSADLTPDSQVRWREAGVTLILGKPARTEELSRMLATLPDRGAEL